MFKLLALDKTRFDSYFNYLLTCQFLPQNVLFIQNKMSENS